MSHIVTCNVQMKDKNCLDRAIKHCGFVDLGEGTHTLWSNQKVTGRGIKLPDWHHPVVIKEDGKAAYDNYNGGWGKQIELDKLVQRYAIETAVDQAVTGGYSYVENKLENGDVELTMTSVVCS